jgi:hypothetical protein
MFCRGEKKMIKPRKKTLKNKRIDRKQKRRR